MNKKTFLCDILPGDCAIVTSIESSGDIQKRFLDIGLISGSEIQCVGESPMKDPRAYLIEGAIIAIRQEDAALIRIKECEV